MFEQGAIHENVVLVELARQRDTGQIRGRRSWRHRDQLKGSYRT